MTTSMAAHALSPLPAWWVSLVTWTSHVGPLGWVIFLGVYLLATLCFVPGWILRLGAGFAFGAIRGTCLAATGSVLGAAAAFVLSRRWLRGTVRRHLAGSRPFQLVDCAIENRGPQIVVLLRLCPILPASLLNYLLGLTTIRFRPYLAASGLGMIPGIVLYAYLGAVSRTEVAVALHHGWGLTRLGLFAVGIAVAFVVVAEMVRPWSRHSPRRAFEGIAKPGGQV